MTSALESWSDQSKVNSIAQKAAIEVTYVDDLLSSSDSGLSISESLKGIKASDPLLTSALQCLPTDKIPSKSELAAKLDKVRSNLEYLSLLPPSGGGLLSQTIAGIGARLKLKASHVPLASGRSYGVRRFQKDSAKQKI